MAKKSKSKKSVPKAKTTAKKTPARAKAPAVGKRRSWLSDKASAPMIDQYARQLKSFINATADGVIDASEVAAQEKRVTALMREIEPKLDNALHARLTELLCELTAYDLMQVLHSMHQERPRIRFRG
jgi:hypothetical protein